MLVSTASKKTETVSYRIRSDLKSAIEEEAKRLGINPNALVAQILSRHIDWGRFIGRLNFVPVSKNFLRLIFETLPTEDIEKAARSLGEAEAHEEILFLYTRISPATIISFLNLWASHFDASDHQYAGGKHVFTVKHDVNLNYSLFTKEYMSSLLWTTIGTKVVFEAMTPNSVTFSFEDSLSSWRAGDNKLRDNTSTKRQIEVPQKRPA